MSLTTIKGIASAALSDPVQVPCGPGPGDRVVDDSSQTFPAEVVNDTQDTEPAPIHQGIGDKVERPALIGGLRHSHWRARSQSSFPVAALAHRETLVPVDPVEVFPIRQ